MKKTLLAVFVLASGLAGLVLLSHQGYHKTVIEYYGNSSSLPSKIAYSEYNDKHQKNYSGDLSITDIRPSNGGYYATYQGILRTTDR